MAELTKAYADSRGGLHHTAHEAVISDIANALGRVGEKGGLTAGVARLILEKRSDIERAFADQDRLAQARAAPPQLPANDKFVERSRRTDSR